MKAIALRSGKNLSSLKTLLQEKVKENAKDLSGDPQEANKELEPDEIIKPTTELKKDLIGKPIKTQVPFPSRLEERQK